MNIRIERTNASKLNINSDTKNIKVMEPLLWNVAEYMSSEDKYVGSNSKVDFIEVTEASDGMVFVTTNLDKDACRRLLEDFFDQLNEEESSDENEK